MPATSTLHHRRPGFCLQVTDGHGLYFKRDLEVERIPLDRYLTSLVLKKLLLGQ
jgi:hypothetical protein